MEVPPSPLLLASAGIPRRRHRSSDCTLIFSQKIVFFCFLWVRCMELPRWGVCLRKQVWPTGFKTWTWKLQRLRRSVWPGKRANRVRFSWSPTSHFGRGIQRRLPFLHNIILKNRRHAPVSANIVFERDLSENRPHFRMKRRYIAGSLFLIFFSESGNTVKYANDAQGEKDNASHQRIASTLRRASPFRYNPGCKTPKPHRKKRLVLFG